MEYIKISRLPAKLFRTIEFPEFASDICKVVEKHNRPELKIDEVFSMLKSAMTEVEKITVSERSHPLTAQLQTLRADIDNNLVALTTLIKGVSKIKVENVNEAGLKALPVLRRFISGINRKNFFQKRKFMDAFKNEITKGRSELEIEVRNKLNDYIVNIRKKIESSFNDFDGLLQYEESQLAKLDSKYNSIKSDLDKQEKELKQFDLV